MVVGMVQASGCPAEVVTEHAAQPLVGVDGPAGQAHMLSRFDQAVLKTLVIPFPMVMSEELRDCTAQSTFTEEDHLVEALSLDGENEPFTMGVQVRRAWRQSYGLDSDIL